jgi:peptidoglycan/xylan/chitin deacetylase (PgdA/CDA1 family)
MNKKVLSVFWHSVDADCCATDSGNPTLSMFREQIKFLTNHYAPITLVEFLEIQHGGGSARYYEKPPLLLGFDDGFKNVIRYALPVLEEFGVPAVFFVIGEVLNNPNFVPWYVERKHLLRKSTKGAVTYRRANIDLSSQQGRVRLKSLFDAFFRNCKADGEREEVMSELADVLALKRPSGVELDEDLRFVERRDLSQLAPSSMLTVSSHAMTHRDLAILSIEDQLAELEQSDRILRSYAGSYFPAIAYPNGSFNSDTLAIASHIYRAGFAVLLGSSHRNLYAYPRVGIGKDSVRELCYAISSKRLKYILPLKRFLHVTGIRRRGIRSLGMLGRIAFASRTG